MIKYTPNFSDPRVKKKIQSAIGWSCACLKADVSKTWSRTHLDKKIGYSHHKLGNFLRHHLLSVDRSHWNKDTKLTKSYILNINGVKMLSKSIGIPVSKKFQTRLAIDFLKQKHEKELSTGNFLYQDKSNRYWNDIQRINSRIRTQLFVEYNYLYNYDIKSAAPTLIYEYAVSTGLSKRLKLDCVKQYLNDPNAARQELAKRINVDVSVAKKVIIIAFSGGRMGPQNSIAREIKNRISYYKLSKDLWFKQLIREILKLWKHIKKYRGINKMSSSTKWRIYFELERRVMWNISDLFKKNKARIFLEHDGWRSDLYISGEELTAYIKNKTGFVVQFDIDIYNKCRLHDTANSLTLSATALL